MRVAFLTQCRPCRELGGGRAQFEIAEEWRRARREAVLLGPEDLLRLAGGGTNVQAAFERWLQQEGAGFDVVDYDHNYLLPARSSLPERVRYVARSVLFWPFVPLLLAEDYAGLRRKLVAKWKVWRGQRGKAPQPLPAFPLIAPALRRADAVNLPNTRDVHMAQALGVRAERVLCIPYALDREQRRRLDEVRGEGRPELVFLGTFDSRKGAGVLPQILRLVRQGVPEAGLTLLGSGVSADRVLAAFPRELRAAVRVVPRFSNERLPELLGACAVGVFPSRHEGFGFAVLEQLQAGLPVVAYDAPGPCDILPPEWLVPSGEANALAETAGTLLKRVLAGERLAPEARAAARRFCIEEVAERTWEAYAGLCARGAEAASR